MTLFTRNLAYRGGTLAASMLILSSVVISDVTALLGSSPQPGQVKARDVWNDSVYVGSIGSATVSKLDKGTTLWRTKVTADAGASVHVILQSSDNGRIYVVGSRTGGGFLAQLAQTGEKLSYRRIDRPVESLTINSNGDVYLGGDGFLRKLTADLTPIYELKVDGRVRALTSDAKGLSYAAIAGTGKPSRLARIDEDAEGWKWEVELESMVPASLMVDCTGTVYVTGVSGVTTGYDDCGELTHVMPGEPKETRLDSDQRRPTLLTAVISLKRLL